MYSIKKITNLPAKKWQKDQSPREIFGVVNKDGDFIAIPDFVIYAAIRKFPTNGRNLQSKEIAEIYAKTLNAQRTSLNFGQSFGQRYNPETGVLYNFDDSELEIMPEEITDISILIEKSQTN